jgi:hypothetical protein
MKWRGVCRGVNLLYLHACAFQYRYIPYRIEMLQAAAPVQDLDIGLVLASLSKLRCYLAPPAPDHGLPVGAQQQRAAAIINLRPEPLLWLV